MAAVLDKIDVNGVEVPFIFEKDDRLPIATIQLVFKGGGGLADGDLPGRANFAASILNEGTKALGATGFAKKQEARAINLSVGAGRETFTFEIGALKEQFPYAVELLKELMADPNLTDKALEKVKTRKLGGLMQKESDFDYVASRELKALIFQGTPLAVPSQGTPESVKAMTLDAVKEHLGHALQTAKAIVVAGGAMSMEEAKKYAGELLSPLPKGEAFTIPYYDANDKARAETVKKETQQAYVYFAAPFYGKATDDDAYKARVASFILGASGFGSRLMEEIRVKRGLAYSAYGRINTALSHSWFTGHLQTKIESGEEAVKLVGEVVSDFLKNGVTQEELDDAKKFLLGSEPLRNETLSQRLGRDFNDYYKGKPQGWSDDQLTKMESLTLKELNDYIASHQEIGKLTFSIVTR